MTSDEEPTVALAHLRKSLMSALGPTPRYTLSDLSYRRATWSDHALLKRYRLECGWGLERMENDLKGGEEGDTPLWVFSLNSDTNSKSDSKGVGGGGQTEEVGMGGLVLDSETQRFMADRSSGTIKLSSLYIDRPHQSLGLGSLCLDLLEHLAITHYSARVLTLDTTPYMITEDGEETGREGRNLSWYRRRGYEEFRERIPYYQQPLAKYHAAFLRKTVVRESVDGAVGVKE